MLPGGSSVAFLITVISTQEAQMAISGPRTTQRLHSRLRRTTHQPERRLITCLALAGVFNVAMRDEDLEYHTGKEDTATEP